MPDPQPDPQPKENETNPKSTDQENRTQTSSTEEQKPDEKPAEPEGEQKVKTVLEGEEKPKEEEGKPDFEPLTLESLEVPDGLVGRDKDGNLVEADVARMEQFLGLANEEKIPPAAANKLLGMYAKMQEEAGKAAWTAWEQKNKTWAEELQSDPDIGGDKLSPAVNDIGSMVDEFGEPGFLDAMAFTGAGNHPAIVKTLAKVARVLREGDLVKGGATQEQPKSLADLMYKSKQGDG